MPTAKVLRAKRYVREGYEAYVTSYISCWRPPRATHVVDPVRVCNTDCAIVTRNIQGPFLQECSKISISSSASSVDLSTLLNNQCLMQLLYLHQQAYPFLVGNIGNYGGL